MSSIGTKYLLAQRFVFDPNNNSLIDKINGNELNRLGSNESRILLLFSIRPNQVITRDELHEFVWREQGFQVDDSSLTQAISTLRKVLLDSTKAPKFVKTVPKRGYQFIASVEKTIPLSSSINEDASLAEEQQETENQEPLKAVELESRDEINSIATSENNPLSVTSILILIVAVLLPIFIYQSIEPAPSKFKLIDTVDNVPLLTTENHPQLNEWQPLINHCVSTYLSEHKKKPVEIIITAGPSNNLILNYVHSEDNVAENVTIQLIAKQQEMSALCKGVNIENVKP